MLTKVNLLNFIFVEPKNPQFVSPSVSFNPSGRYIIQQKASNEGVSLLILLIKNSFLNFQMLLDTLQITGTNAGSLTVLELRCCDRGPCQIPFCPGVPLSRLSPPLLPRKTRSPPPRQDDPQQVHQDSRLSFGDPHKKNQKPKKHPQSDMISGLNWTGTLYQRIRFGAVSRLQIEASGETLQLFGNDSLICPL